MTFELLHKNKNHDGSEVSNIINIYLFIFGEKVNKGKTSTTTEQKRVWSTESTDVS